MHVAWRSWKVEYRLSSDKRPGLLAYTGGMMSVRGADALDQKGIGGNRDDFRGGILHVFFDSLDSW